MNIITKRQNCKSKSILVFDLNGKKIIRCNSLSDVKIKLNVKSVGNIYSVCTGSSHTYKDMIFIYEEEYTDELLKQRVYNAQNRRRRDNAKPILMKDLYTGEVLAEYISAYKAEDDGFIRSCIRMVCNKKLKSHAGYAWEYKGE